MLIKCRKNDITSSKRSHIYKPKKKPWYIKTSHSYRLSLKIIVARNHKESKDLSKQIQLSLTLIILKQASMDKITNSASKYMQYRPWFCLNEFGIWLLYSFLCPFYLNTYTNILICTWVVNVTCLVSLLIYIGGIVGISSDVIVCWARARSMTS